MDTTEQEMIQELSEEDGKARVEYVEQTRPTEEEQLLPEQVGKTNPVNLSFSHDDATFIFEWRFFFSICHLYN